MEDVNGASPAETTSHKASGTTFSNSLTQPSVAQSPLFRLPKELRERIWEFTLTADRPLLWPNKVKPRANLPSVALLLTCRAIHEEASVALYRMNTMMFRHPSDANMFLYIFNRQYTAHIRHLMLHVQGADVQSIWTGYLSSNVAFRSLKHDFPALRSLDIVFLAPVHFHSDHHDAITVYRRWISARWITTLTAALQDRVEQDRVKVRVLYMRHTTREQGNALLESNRSDFDLRPAGTPGPRLRTKWKVSNGCDIAMDCTERDSPWTTLDFF
jgi:hypothetical protein